jgi:TPR repeat protein
MSHRVYLYNVNHPVKPSAGDIMMIEWGYEIPIFLQPLLVNGSIVSGNVSVAINMITIDNSNEQGNDSSLSYHAADGIENLKRFYNFIERHQDELIDETKQFKIAKERLFEYLDNLDQSYFNLDASDVFNMGDENHSIQAQEWVEKIRNNNTIISNAIETDNIFQLDLLFPKDKVQPFNDFKSLFNEPGYNYGWEVIDIPESVADVEIFEKDSLWGLKGLNEEIIINPVYSEFYEFNEDGIAVVSIDGQFGYVNKAGVELIKPQFDNAFDFVFDYAVAVKSGKYGLIDQKGVVVIDFIYQDLDHLPAAKICYVAQLNDKWGLINISNAIQIPFEHEEKIWSDDFGATYTVSVKDKKTKLIYSHCFVFLTECEPHFVNALNDPDEAYIYEIKKNGESKENLLLNNRGELLLAGYEKIVHVMFYVLMVRKQKKYGLLHYKGGIILDFKYDGIEEFRVPYEEEARNFDPNLPDESRNQNCYFLKIKKNKKCGIFLFAGNFNKQITPIIYDDIVSLNNGYLAVQKDDLWGIVNAFGESFSSIVYDLIVANDVIISSNKAYCLKDDMVYSFSSNVIKKADRVDLQTYIDVNKNMGYSYFKDDLAKRLQAYVDKGIAQDEFFLKKAMDILNADGDTGIAEAVKCLQQAVDLGSSEAMNNLALVYEDADDRNPQYKNTQESFQLFLRSANAGLTVGMMNTADCYAEGVGTPIDIQQMLYWYQQAFNAGEMDAAIKLGEYYYDGINRNSDYVLALKYYLKAEENGDVVHVQLGWLYNNSDNPTLALPYLLRAAANDEGYAYWQLGIYAEYGIEMKINLPLAIVRYHKAIALDYNEAYLNLHHIYTHYPNLKNQVLADEYAQKAMSSGFEIEEKTLLNKIFKLFKLKNK